LMAKCLEVGDFVYAAFHQDYDADSDYRIEYLKRFSKFKIVVNPSSSSRGSLPKYWHRFRHNYFFARALLKLLRINAVYFEWGEGKPDESDIPSWKRIARLFFGDLRYQMLKASAAVKTDTYCLPHGLSTKVNLITNEIVRKAVENNSAPFRDRNSFTRYIFNTDHQRELYVNHMGLNSETSVTWGSMRFSREWISKLIEICPPAKLPPIDIGTMRIVFFLPKWHNNVNKPATISLIRKISELKSIQLVLKNHPRKGEADLDQFQVLFSRNHNCVLYEGDSFSLTSVADCVIDIGSSIVIDALQRDIPAIYPSYLHTNQLIFDKLGGCLMPKNDEETLRQIEEIRKGHLIKDQKKTQEVISNLVYAGKLPFLVSEFYYRNIESITQNQSEG